MKKVQHKIVKKNDLLGVIIIFIIMNLIVSIMVGLFGFILFFMLSLWFKVEVAIGIPALLAGITYYKMNFIFKRDGLYNLEEDKVEHIITNR